MGAGTGFLSLLAARLGHRVTAVDLSQEMLARLRAGAEHEGLDVETINRPAEEPPEGPFDVVVERHLLWTLPDPVAALSAWRAAAPEGRLLSFAGLWGRADPVEVLLAPARNLLRQLRGDTHDPHAPYDREWVGRLPLGEGASPEAILSAVTAAGWRRVTLERLRDVEWARLLPLSPLERLLGVTPQYVIVGHAS